ncbi:MAG: flagellar biosynthetic protein FliR [Firmicutes bacterium]|nr:flagellar biosynthetic protein FliR [Bacillota bacterium]
MRMSGFVLFNPLIGRRGIPAVVQSGIILVLAVTVFSLWDGTIAMPGTFFELAIAMILEMLLGFFLGLVVNIFLYIPLLAGETIDTQMGMSMGSTYDPATQSSVTVSAHVLNALMILLFFAGNGHNTLFRILLASGDIVPFGGVRFGEAFYNGIVDIFVECTLLGVKLCIPILAAEILGQVGMGILMKVIPQINVFAINIELKVIIGLVLLLILVAPMSEYLLEIENQMLMDIQRILALTG